MTRKMLESMIFRQTANRYVVLREMVKLSYSVAVKANLPTLIVAAFLGLLNRIFHISAFVLTLQALMLVVLPNSSRAHALASLNERFQIPLSLEPATEVACVVLVIFLSSLLSQILYHRLLGRMVETAYPLAEKIILESNWQKSLRAHKTATILTSSTVKIVEIAAFLALLSLAIAVANLWAFLIVAILCAAAIGAILIAGRSRPQLNQSVLQAKTRYISSGGTDEMLSRYVKAAEKLRFRNQLSSTTENTIVGVFTVIFIIILSNFRINFEDSTLMILFFVFSVRYSFSYSRELSRSVNNILDLRRDVNWHS